MKGNRGAHLGRVERQLSALPRWAPLFFFGQNFCTGGGSHLTINISIRKRLTKARVARWFVFKPKIPIWVNFGGPSNGKCCFGIFYWYLDNVWQFGIVCSNLLYFSHFGILGARRIWQP
jgi:hypothetical protein